MTIANCPRVINYQNLVAIDELATKQVMTEELSLKAMVEYLKQCVDQKVNLQAVIEGANGDTCLHKAIKEQRVRVIKALHLCGVSWEVKNYGDLTPMALLDRQEKIKSIIHQFLSFHPIQSTVVQTKPSENSSGIQWEALFSSQEEEILKWLKNPNFKRDIQNWRGKNKETLLHLAAAKGTKAILQTLLAIPLAMDVGDEIKQTPVHYAATNNNEITTRFLIEKGARLKTDARDFTPLHNAVAAGSFGSLVIMLGHLHDRLQSSKTCDGNNSFHLAAINGNVAAVSALMAFPALLIGLSEQNKSEFTPLQIAARNGHFGMVKHMMQRDEKGWGKSDANIERAVVLATEKNHTAIKNYLLGETNQESIPTYDDLKKTPSDIKKLVDQGLDLTDLDAKGRTILHRAIEEGLTDLAFTIIEQGGGIPSQPTKPEEYTALHLSAMKGDERLTRYLNEIFFRQSHYKQSHSVSPLRLASQNGHQGIVTYLANAGWGGELPSSGWLS